MRRGTSVSILFVAACAGAGWYGCGKGHDDNADVAPRAAVTVAACSVAPMTAWINATGTFQALKDEKVKSPLAGTVAAVKVREGDRVTRGALLVSIVPKESEAAIAGARELLRLARTGKEIQQAQAAASLAERTASAANITAPFAGAVSTRFVTEGEYVNDGDNLVEVVDPASLYFLAEIPLNRIAPVHAGETATITVPNVPVAPLRGIVAAVNPATDPNSQTLKVRIDLSSPPALVTTGTFGSVRIAVGRHAAAVVVPNAAVHHDDELNRYFVIKVEGDSIALLTRVDVGISDSARTEILSGLRPGDTVATTGGYGLPDSALVSVTRPDADPRP